MKKYTIYSNFGPLDEVSTKKEAEALVKTSGGECWYKLTEPIHKKPLEESKLEKEVKEMKEKREFTAFEKEILERAFYEVDDYYVWRDLIDDEGDPIDFGNHIKPQIEELKKKLGIE